MHTSSFLSLQTPWHMCFVGKHQHDMHHLLPELGHLNSASFPLEVSQRQPFCFQTSWMAGHDSPEEICHPTPTATWIWMAASIIVKHVLDIIPGGGELCMYGSHCFLSRHDSPLPPSNIVANEKRRLKERHPFPQDSPLMPLLPQGLPYSSPHWMTEQRKRRIWKPDTWR